MNLYTQNEEVTILIKLKWQKMREIIMILKHYSV